MDDIESAIEEAFNAWRQTWDLDDMTIRDIYSAGFRHGASSNSEEEKQ